MGRTATDQASPREGCMTESPEARKRRLAHMREYRLRTLDERKQYLKAYYQAHGLDRYQRNGKNPCPDCGQLKVKTAKRCRKCAVKAHAWARELKRPKPKTTPDCLYCGTEMRSLIWHSRKVWRCGGCGLESTPLEVSRFVYEEEIAGMNRVLHSRPSSKAA